MAVGTSFGGCFHDQEAFSKSKDRQYKEWVGYSYHSEC